MANVYQAELNAPRSDTAYRHSGSVETTEIVASTSTATDDPRSPSGDVSYWSTGKVEAVRGLVKVTSGTVTAATVSVYTLEDTTDAEGTDGDWYWHQSVDLTEMDGSSAFAIEILGKYTNFTMRVSDITGGGTVAVRAVGVWQ